MQYSNNGTLITAIDQTNPGFSNAVAGAQLVTVSAFISNGGTTSGAIPVNGKMIAGIDLGQTLTSTTLGVQNAVDGKTYRTAKDSTGAALSWTVTGNGYLKFDPPLLGYISMKLVAGSAEGADRTLTVVLVP